ncbi:MAG: succinate dehydrogenase, cytochrome b556 subunit [Hydrogenophilus sp.]|nr:succinate dehydrogenase, cytochrome b556 subunit [Hydrogenophilus sp.]
MAELRQRRPKFLNLLEIHLPLPGVVSILHRISGAGLFLLLPFLIYLLDLSLMSPVSFARFEQLVDHGLVKVILLGVLWAYLHHLCAGVRFLLIDLHIGVDRTSAFQSARVVLMVSVALTVVLGVWLW